MQSNPCRLVWNLFCYLNFSTETANSSEKQHFLGFASFVSGLGPHPFIPALIGAVSVQSPVMMVVVEELQHRDLLGFLWRCRQVHGCQNLTLRFTLKLQCGDMWEYVEYKTNVKYMNDTRAHCLFIILLTVHDIIEYYNQYELQTLWLL